MSHSAAHGQSDVGHDPRTLVIGASGFVGRELMRQLTRNTRPRASNEASSETLERAAVRSLSGTYCRQSPETSKDAIHWLHLDLTVDQQVERLLAEQRPQRLFLLAYDRANLESTVIAAAARVCHALTHSAPECRVIYLSTDAVFDGAAPPYCETDTPKPIEAYGRAKRQAELTLLAHGACVVRTSLVYGFNPQDPRTQDIARGATTGEYPHPYFSDEIRSPIFVEDLCRALLELADRFEPERTLHVAGPDAMDRFAFAQKTAEILGFPNAILPQATLRESGLTRPANVTLDIRRAQRELKTELRSLEQVAQHLGGKTASSEQPQQ